MQRQYEHIFKIILIGSTSVGKTALLKRFADNEFNQTYLSTIGIDFRFKSFYLDQQYIKLQIWDTAGQQRFRNITKSYYNGSHAIVIVYDANDERSFIDVKEHWIKDALTYCQARQILVVGNKCDDQFRQYIKQEHVEWAKENGVEIVGVSAKTGGNVQEVFEQLTRKLIELNPKIQGDVLRLGLEEKHRVEKKQCRC